MFFLFLFFPSLSAFELEMELLLLGLYYWHYSVMLLIKFMNLKKTKQTKLFLSEQGSTLSASGIEMVARTKKHFKIWVEGQDWRINGQTVFWENDSFRSRSTQRKYIAYNRALPISTTMWLVLCAGDKKGGPNMLTHRGKK